MGAVYVGEQKLGATTRRVAVKTLHPHLSKDPKVKARFEREVGTIAELEHPNTIQVFDFGTTEEDGLLYLVMEFVDGTNVSDVIEKTGPMDPRRVEKIMTQVCGSLEEAHSRGIIHRDLKPENVVLTERAGQKDFVKVLDFGIAKRSNEEDPREQKLTQQGMVLGTPPYMSPEQFTGKPIDARSDIYSLGVMMYEMLTGRLPFNANTAWEWATQHMTVPPIALEATGAHVPQRMRDSIMRSLEKDPTRRFANVREFCDAFAGSTSEGAAASGPAVPRSAQPTRQEPMKGKTQLGEPIIPGGGFGPPPQAGYPGAPTPVMGPAMGQAHGTPSAGNLAVPAIPAAPPRDQGGGGGRAGLLAAIGIIGVLSVGAIAYALMPHHSNVPDTALDLDSGPSQVNLAPASSGPEPTTPPTLDTTIASLNTRPVPPPPSPHPQPARHDGGAAPSKPSGGGTTPPGPTPPPAAEPPECAKARNAQANPSFGKDPAITNMYNVNRAACISKGGKL